MFETFEEVSAEVHNYNEIFSVEILKKVVEFMYTGKMPKELSEEDM